MNTTKVLKNILKTGENNQKYVKKVKTKKYYAG